jgi:hypothetical protein
MATRKKKVVDDNYSKLDQYAIELNEFYKSLRKAGFSVEIAMGVLGMKELHPEWMVTAPTLDEVRKHLEEDED